VTEARTRGDDEGATETGFETKGAAGERTFRRWSWTVKRTGRTSQAAAEIDEGVANPGPSSPTPRKRLSILTFFVVPALALLMALGVGYLKYQVGKATDDVRAAAESARAAQDGTVAMLSYTPDTAEASLGAARDRLTGAFRDSYSSLIHDVVIPGARQRTISSTATVAAAAPVSATEHHAVVLVFVNQALTVGKDAPTSTASVVEVSLERSGSRWLISGFEPK
jgi:Mce-associated membrane protein